MNRTSLSTTAAIITVKLRRSIMFKPREGERGLLRSSKEKKKREGVESCTVVEAFVVGPSRARCYSSGVHRADPWLPDITG